MRRRGFLRHGSHISCLSWCLTYLFMCCHPTPLLPQTCIDTSVGHKTETFATECVTSLAIPCVVTVCGLETVRGCNLAANISNSRSTPSAAASSLYCLSRKYFFQSIFTLLPPSFLPSPSLSSSSSSSLSIAARARARAPLFPRFPMNASPGAQPNQRCSREILAGMLRDYYSG